MSAHGRTHWIKLYIEMLNDPKIGLLPDAIKWRWVSVLLLAGETNEDGFLPDVSDMAWRLHTNVETLQDEMQAIAERRLVELRLYEDGTERWFVIAFAKRQEAANSTDRSRMLRHRRQQKSNDNNEDVQRNVAQKSRNTEYRIQNTETETETEYQQNDVYDTRARGQPEATSENIEQLSNHFRELTALTPNQQSPSWVTNWRDPLTRFLDLTGGDVAAAIAAMNTAVETARAPGRKRYTIASPKSLETFYVTAINGRHDAEQGNMAAEVWRRAVDACARRQWDDERLKAAVRAIGGSGAVSGVSEREQPELQMRLWNEYRRITAAA